MQSTTSLTLTIDSLVLLLYVLLEIGRLMADRALFPDSVPYTDLLAVDHDSARSGDVHLVCQFDCVLNSMSACVQVSVLSMAYPTLGEDPVLDLQYNNRRNH